MPSAFTHAAAALAIGAWFYEPGVPAAVWVAGAACAVVPDLDAIGFWAGVPYDSFFGHRGVSHSLAFAALLAAAVGLALRRRYPTPMTRWSLLLFLFLATASHGILDMFTNGGGGIALLAPFDNGRFFAPWRPILVAPISISRFFTARGLAVFLSELMWVWLPAAACTVLAVLVRRRAAPDPVR